MSTPSRAAVGNERGSALILALILVVVLTFVGFGLVTRALMVTRIAGAERWSTKAFYAADAGINAAKQRLRIRRTQAFTFQLADLRGPAGGADFGDIDVAVTDMASVGAPQPAVGTQVGGGQGAGAEPLYFFFYKGMSTATEEFTRSEAVVTSTFSVGPMPLTIPTS